MKKLLASSVLALTLLAGSQQSASAWCCFRFGIGFNADFSCGGNCCGGNCCLWGLWCNGPAHGDYFGNHPVAGWYAPSLAAGYPSAGYPAAPMAGYPAPYYQAQGYYPYAGYPANYHLMSYPYA